MSWLTSPPALLAGFLASVIAILQFLRPVTRKIILFPRLKAEQQLGHALVPIIHALTTGKIPRLPEAEPEMDFSPYSAKPKA